MPATAWLNTVAKAAPKAPMRNTMMHTRSSPMFSALATSRKYRGPLAVAQSTHQGTGHIIKKGEGDAPEDGADVNICNIDDVGRGVGPHQHGAGERHGDHRQHHCKGYRQPHGVGRVRRISL